MEINPQDYEITIDEIRERLHLSKEITITPFGYEKSLDSLVLGILKTKYDAGALFIRTRPDFFVIDGVELYFVEAKQGIKYVEAIQLYFNQQLEKCGIKVLYSFPKFAIRARLIPINKVVIPENYKEDFEKNLKCLFLAEGIRQFSYVRYVENGSGDAFVPIDVNALMKLSEKVLA